MKPLSNEYGGVGGRRLEVSQPKIIDKNKGREFLQQASFFLHMVTQNTLRNFCFFLTKCFYSS